MQGLLCHSTTNCLAPGRTPGAQGVTGSFLLKLLFLAWGPVGSSLLLVSLCHPPCVGLCVHVSSSNKDTGHTGLGPAHECILFTSLKTPIFKCSHCEVLGARTSTYEFVGRGCSSTSNSVIVNCSYICVGSSLTKMHGASCVRACTAYHACVSCSP